MPKCSKHQLNLLRIAFHKPPGLPFHSVSRNFPTFSPFFYFSSFALSPNPTPQSKPEKDDENELSVLGKIFKSDPQLGSHKLEDATFYSLIENYASFGEFRLIEQVLDRMKHEGQLFLDELMVRLLKRERKLSSLRIDMLVRCLHRRHQLGLESFKGCANQRRFKKP